MNAWLEQHGARAVRWALVAILVLAAGLRFHGIGAHWLNPDEGIYYSVISWPDLARRSAEIAENAHPPFYYHLLWLWSRVSMDFAWLRTLAALAGIAGVYGMFLLGREVAGERRGAATGLLAALLMAIAPAAVTLSQIIRPYTLQIALIVFALVGLLRWHRHGGRRGLVTFAACMSVALLTHYSSALALGAAGLPFVVLLARRRLPRPALVPLLVATAVPVVTLFVIWVTHIRGDLAGSALQAKAFEGWLRPHIAKDFLQAWRQGVCFTGYMFGEPLTGVATVAFLAALGVAAQARAGAVWLTALGAFLAAGAASRLHLYPFGPTRHSAWLAPFLLVPIAWALVHLLAPNSLRRWITLGALALALLARESLYIGVTGGFRVPTLGSEFILSRADFETMRPRLDALRDSPGLLLTSQDSLKTFAPIWQRERETATVREGMQHFRWGQREVLVHSEWSLNMQGTQLGKGEHVFDFLEKAERLFPELGVGKQRRAPMLFAGFHLSAMQGLLDFDRSRNSPNRIVIDPAAVAGLGVLTLDAMLFLREAREALAKLPPRQGDPTGR